MIEKICIVSGPIRSGKTSRLQRWMENRNDVSGIITPVINNKRFFMDASSKEMFSMEAEPREENVIAVGRYIFSSNAFNHAEKILENSLHQNKSWLIIDEVGPLELSEKGFDGILKKILLLRHPENERPSTKLLLVIRENLLDAVVSQYQLQPYDIFTYD
jgi:nucleoside-triphosphatase